MEINAQQFETEVIKAKVPILVEFWASWCPPCQTMKPILAELAQEYEGRVKVVKINSDLNSSLAAEYKVMGLPTFIFFDQEKEIKREVSAKSKEELSKMIDNFLKDGGK